MDSKKTLPTSPRGRPKPGYRGLSANQVIAYNLARARELRGLTQDEAAEALAPFLGARWSKASFSQAERSVGGKVIRKFDADEVVAFARAFDLPVTWFYLPPPPMQDGQPVKLSTADARRTGQEVALLVDLVFGDDRQQALLTARLREFLKELGTSRLTKAQRRVADFAVLRFRALVRHSLGELDEWQGRLHQLADHLGELERAATAAFTNLAPNETGD